MVEQLPDVMGLKALSVNEELGHSPCRENNGGCSHLCFNRPDGKHVCDCPLGEAFFSFLLLANLVENEQEQNVLH